MNKKISVFILLLFIGILPIAEALTLYDSQTTSDTVYGNIVGAAWEAQTITPTTTHQITVVSLLLYQSSADGTVTVSMRAGTNPTGVDLCNATMAGSSITTNSAGAWYNFSMSPTVYFSSGNSYSIVVRYSGNGYVRWLISVGGGYAGGNLLTSTNSGSSWTNRTYDGTFYEYGNPDTTAPTYSSLTASSAVANSTCSFSSTWSDDLSLSGYIFSSNNTGTWANNTWTAFTSTPQTVTASKTLNSTIANVVSYKWFANDTANNWNSTTQQNLTTTQTSYVVLLTGKTTATLDETVSINAQVLKGGVWFGNWVMNITNNGGLFIGNLTDRTFTFTEPSAVTHTFDVTGLVDTAIETAVNFTVTPLVVVWDSLSGDGSPSSGRTPTPTPMPFPTETPTASPLIDFENLEVSQEAIAGGIVIVIFSVMLAGTFAFYKPKKHRNVKVAKPEDIEFPHFKRRHT